MHTKTYPAPGLNDNNTDVDVYGTVIMTVAVARVHLTQRQPPPTLISSQLTLAVSLLIGCYRPHPPSPFIIITQSESLILPCHRVWKAPWHCSENVQPVPKAVV